VLFADVASIATEVISFALASQIASGASEAGSHGEKGVGEQLDDIERNVLSHSQFNIAFVVCFVDTEVEMDAAVL
jgi:hypothetical protein